MLEKSASRIPQIDILPAEKYFLIRVYALPMRLMKTIVDTDRVVWVGGRLGDWLVFDICENWLEPIKITDAYLLS